MGQQPRYHFCIQVDEASLQSVVHSPSRVGSVVADNGWVKLISKNWNPIKEDPHARPNPNVYEPIEGITEMDVGWMKIPLEDVMKDAYTGNEMLNGWRANFVRPPAVVGWPYDER